MAQATTALHAHGAHDHGDHAHPTTGTYLMIGVVLFVLTALEVALYEVTHGENISGFGRAVAPIFVELLLALSAVKFALVALYYMHLKQDGRLLKVVFVFSLTIATIVILGLMVLFYYHYHYTT